MIRLLQSAGYLISTFSVGLLGAVAWTAAKEDDTLFLCLILGMATSIIGMLLRWAAFMKEQKDKAELEAEVDAMPRAERDRSGHSGQAAASGRAGGISIPSRS